LGISQWANSDEGFEPDMVMACEGDVPTLEKIGAVQILRELCMPHILFYPNAHTSIEHSCYLCELRVKTFRKITIKKCLKFNIIA